MENNETSTVNIVDKKKNNNAFKYIFIFLIFFVIGAVIGVFGAIKYFEDKEKENNIEDEIVDNRIKDITEDEDSQELINKLYSTVNGNVLFYSTKGVSANTIDNTSKLILVYNKLVTNNIGSTESLPSTLVGSFTCMNDEFVTDPGADVNVSTNKCSVVRILKSEFMKMNKSLFNDDILDTSVSFNPSKTRKCIVDGESYLCGNIKDLSGITGELESKFVIEKVTKDNDGAIFIYEKGYLIDRRSNINNPNDQYDNYYLHSSDSKDYYYELKSADNLTFKHTYKKDNNDYYYVSTELVKE